MRDHVSDRTFLFLSIEIGHVLRACALPSGRAEWSGGIHNFLMGLI